MSDLNISISSTCFKVLQTEASYRGLSLEKLAEKVLHHYVADYPRSVYAENVEAPENEVNVSSTQPDSDSALETLVLQENILAQKNRGARANEKTSHENAGKFRGAKAA